MKIYLRIPTNDSVDRETTRWYGWVHRALPEADIGITYTACFGIAEGRNQIVRSFLQTDCTHLWMVDSDVVPPYHLKLLEGAQEHPILAGPYRGFVRGHIIWHVWYQVRQEKDKRVYVSKHNRKWPSQRYFHADAAGAGCLLIQREVLEAKSEPYFQYDLYADGTRGTEDMRFAWEHGGVTIDSEYRCRHYRDADLEELVKATLQ